MTFRYLATGKMQLCSSDDCIPRQPTTSQSITQILHALTRPDIMTWFICFPIQSRDSRRNQAKFRNIVGFPGVVRVIDCTHLKIIAPKEFQAEYVNRKKNHSMNTQIVFDPCYHILDLVAKWPRATHDACIQRESGLKLLMESNRIPRGCHLLLDLRYLSKQ